MMHRQHHAFSDTEKDPHSPHFLCRHLPWMMKATIITFGDYVKIRPKTPKRNFPVTIPSSALLTGWVLLSCQEYYLVRLILPASISFFAAHWWMFLLLPIHFMMVPSVWRSHSLTGAVINTAIRILTTKINQKIQHLSTS